MKWLKIITVVLVAVSTDASAQLKIPYSSMSGYQWPVFIAEQRGLFTNNKLDVRLVYTEGAGLAVQAVLSGDAPLASLAPAIAILAWTKGTDLVLVAGGIDRVLNSLMVSPKIKRPEDLRGKTVGISRFGTLSEWVLAEALKLHNMRVGQDVIALQLGGLAERVAALTSGRIEGAILNVAEEFQVSKLGYHSVIDMKRLPPYPGQGIVTSRRFIKTDRESVKGFLKAYVDGIKILKTDKQFSMSVLERRLKIHDREILSKTHDIFQEAFDAVRRV